MQGLMRACVFHKYGSKANPTDVLNIENVPKPKPKKDEVLLKVKSASVHKGDYHLVTGTPFVVRLMFGGIFTPKITIPGTDVSGIVEEIGADVSKLKVGDEVFGDLTPTNFQGFAEYAVAKETALAKKPEKLSFDEASTIPTSGVTALLALKETGKLQKGSKVRHAGGVGSFAVQIAKEHGCEVTGTCSTDKLSFVKSLGADHVIDYKNEDFTKNGMQYDAIVDTAMNRKLTDHTNSLTPQGHFALVGGDNIIGSMITAMRITKKGGKEFTTVTNMEPSTSSMEYLGDLMATGKIVPTVDKCYSLDEAANAMKYLVTDRKVKGKVVISLDDRR
eukprot:scaffold401_cov399-Prasinococcus_capsulatus_cf.AAC.12